MQVYARPHASCLSGHSPGTSLFGWLSWNQLLVYGALKIVVFIRALVQGGWLVEFAIGGITMHSTAKKTQLAASVLQFMVQSCAALHCNAQYSADMQLEVFAVNEVWLNEKYRASSVMSRPVFHEGRISAAMVLWLCLLPCLLPCLGVYA